MSRDFDMVTEVSLRCRCGKRVEIGHTVGDDVPVAIHEMPPCPDYVKRDLADYVSWLRPGGRDDRSN